MEDGDIHPSVHPLSVRITFSLKGKTKISGSSKKDTLQFLQMFQCTAITHISDFLYIANFQTYNFYITTLDMNQPAMTVASKVIAVVMVRVDRDEMDRRLHTTEVSLMV